MYISSDYSCNGKKYISWSVPIVLCVTQHMCKIYNI